MKKGRTTPGSRGAILAPIYGTELLDSTHHALQITILYCRRPCVWTSGTNKGEEFLSLTDSDVDDIQEFSAKLASLMQRLFRIGKTSKIHRMACHIGENIRNYGPLAHTDTSENESLHRHLKRSYLATNKKLDSLGSQILQVNLPADLLSRSALYRFANRNKLFTTKEAQLSNEAAQLFRPTDPAEFHQQLCEQKRVSLAVNNKIALIRREHPEYPIEEVFNSVATAKIGVNSQAFVRLMTATIAAKLTWIKCREAHVRQTIYGGDKLEAWGSRHDCVVYEDYPHDLFANANEDNYTSVGIVEGFLRLKTDKSRNPSVAVIRRLEVAAPQPGNAKIVEEFHFRRYKYKLLCEDVDLICVPLLSIGRRLDIVHDIYEIITRKDDTSGRAVYSYDQQVSELPSTPEERRKSHFFSVPNHKVSTLGEDDFEVPATPDPLDSIEEGIFDYTSIAYA